LKKTKGVGPTPHEKGLKKRRSKKGKKGKKEAVPVRAPTHGDQGCMFLFNPDLPAQP